MEFPNIHTLKEDAAFALRRGREPKKVVLHFAGITMLLSAALTVLSYWLGLQIGNTGGLSNLGTRAIFSTAQSTLPLVQTVVLLSLELGYIHAMMRISRGQYADQTDLKVGFRKFFPLLRLVLLQSLLYFAVGFLAYQVATTVYMFTPWAEDMMELVLPLADASGAMDTTALMSDAFLTQAAPLMVPLLVIFGIVLLLLIIPVSYRMRFAQYALLDDPKGRAFAALRTSYKMTRRNCVRLFRLDLSFWWYYLLTVLVSLLAYLDGLLPMVGIQLPMNETVAFFLFYSMYLVATFAMIYCLRNRVECTYILAYESLREKPANDGVVLGNIFEM